MVEVLVNPGWGRKGSGGQSQSTRRFLGTVALTVVFDSLAQ